jgi:hypothetical protein
VDVNIRVKALAGRTYKKGREACASPRMATCSADARDPAHFARVHRVDGAGQAGIEAADDAGRFQRGRFVFNRRSQERFLDGTRLAAIIARRGVPGGRDDALVVGDFAVFETIRPEAPRGASSDPCPCRSGARRRAYGTMVGAWAASSRWLCAQRYEVSRARAR